MLIDLAGRAVGDGQPCYVIGEIGINHNGSIDTAQRLIVAAAAAGCDAVKFQKRTVNVVYTTEELDRPRESPFGSTNGDLKRGLEFTEQEYDFLSAVCREHGLQWFASCWDHESVDFIERFDPPCHKVASAMLTDLEWLHYLCTTDRPIIMSTGMSTLDQVDAAVRVVEDHGNELLLMHCVATYPSQDRDLNLACIKTLRDTFDVPVGYSGHERGLATTLAAVALGACAVERHITLDRTMWGSDQAASIEPHALCRLVRDIRAVESARGDGVKRLLKVEEPIAAKLRRVC
jgi:N-acetylneuraminate synthase